MVTSKTIVGDESFEGPDYIYQDYKKRQQWDVERNQREPRIEVSKPDTAGLDAKFVRPKKAKAEAKITEAVQNDLKTRNLN